MLYMYNINKMLKLCNGHIYKIFIILLFSFIKCPLFKAGPPQLNFLVVLQPELFYGLIQCSIMFKLLPR